MPNACQTSNRLWMWLRRLESKGIALLLSKTYENLYPSFFRDEPSQCIRLPSRLLCDRILQQPVHDIDIRARGHL